MGKFFASIILSSIFLVGCASSADESNAQNEIKEAIDDETGLEIELLEDYEVSTVAASTHPIDQSNYTELQVAYQKTEAIEDTFTSEDAIDHIQESVEKGSYFEHAGDDGIAIAYRPQPVELNNENLEVSGKKIAVEELDDLTKYIFNHNDQALTITVFKEKDVEEIIKMIVE